MQILSEMERTAALAAITKKFPNLSASDRKMLVDATAERLGLAYFAAVRDMRGEVAAHIVHHAHAVGGAIAAASAGVSDDDRAVAQLLGVDPVAIAKSRNSKGI